MMPHHCVVFTGVVFTEVCSVYPRVTILKRGVHPK